MHVTASSCWMKFASAVADVVNDPEAQLGSFDYVGHGAHALSRQEWRYYRSRRAARRDVDEQHSDAEWASVVSARSHPFNDTLEQILEGVPACGLRFWDNPPYRPLSSVARSKMLGTYVAQSSAAYFGSLEVSEEGEDLVLDYGVLSAPLKFYTDEGKYRIFVWDSEGCGTFDPGTKRDGKFELELGVVFRQE
ncbi:hypothetical protein PHYPSEUDO_010508 [Phytophthora pseudosyringae]|uniref:Uncharacterized protein n=1 Tax=Phytophthora pseudosyringae TaxID=221518 RepID=A0A8T1WB38_9STRA|nr:hypothetical protein PHYPSEUDO_010508 [Phytophthora pseudosyringae]